MELEADFFVVGMYEDFVVEVFPTHVAPIIAERSDAGYRRWHYIIDKPYRIRPVEAIGKYTSSPDKLFPVVTYHLCTPQKLYANSQVIAISQHEIVVERNKAYIIFKVIKSMFRIHNLCDRTYRIRAWRTICNVWV